MGGNVSEAGWPGGGPDHCSFGGSRWRALWQRLPGCDKRDSSCFVVRCAMQTITIDQSLRSQLHITDSEAQLCDEAGKVVGYLLSPELHRRVMAAWVRTPASEEELRRVESEPDGRLFSEVIAE